MITCNFTAIKLQTVVVGFIDVINLVVITTKDYLNYNNVY